MRILKSLLLLLALGTSLLLAAQEKWDAAASVYVNQPYGFAWNLDNALDWEKTIGTEEHTVFRARCTNIDLVAFVNVQYLLVDNVDIWSKFDELKKMNEALGKQAMNKNGYTLKVVTFEKSHLSGRHAIKVVSQVKPKKGIQNTGTPFTSYTLRTFYRGRIWAITLTIPTYIDEALKKEGIQIDYLFAGFKFTAS